MIISSGKPLSELLSLFLMLRKCCQMALMYYDCVTEPEKCLRLAFLIKSFVLLRYFFIQAKTASVYRRHVFTVRTISSLYQTSIFLDLTRLVLYGAL